MSFSFKLSISKMATAFRNAGFPHVSNIQTPLSPKAFSNNLRAFKCNLKYKKISCSNENYSEKRNASVTKRSLLGLAASAAIFSAVDSSTFSAPVHAEPAVVPLESRDFPDLVDALNSPSVSCGSVSSVQLLILGSSVLGVSAYPDFVYNPIGGGSLGNAVDSGNGIVEIKFDPGAVYIPSVQSSSTTLLGVPIPPPLKIDIVPEMLEGYLDRNTGEVKLTFKAKFFFSAGSFYKAPPLLVDTILTTEYSQGVTRKAQGQRMDSNGRCRLVGTARVPPVNDTFLTNFLMLPADVVAELPAQFQIMSTTGNRCPVKFSDV